MSVIGEKLFGTPGTDLREEIREDFFVHAALELQRYAPWLFSAMFVNSMIAMFAGAQEAHWIVRYLLPGLMAAYCAISICALRSDWEFREKPWRARKFLRQSAISSLFGAIVCTAWCILSWLSAPVEERMHFPIILVVGGLATAYCLANIKVGAFANLAIDLIPISILMILSGNSAEIAAAVSLLLAGAFQGIMISAHHRRVIELLELQHNARLQAATDPLTGLANRRALLDMSRKQARGTAPVRLMLIDIDHFKQINDEFGHDSGDAVLCELAEIIGAHAPPGTLPARIGGEEFALFGPAECLPEASALALLHDIRSCAMPHRRQVTASIGIADGRLAGERDWSELFARADEALYEAKNGGRNRYASASAVRPAGQRGNRPALSTAA